jgi:hypothetical protein
MNSVLLRRAILGVIAVGFSLVSSSAFASCGEVGRPACEDPVLARVEVVGVFDPFDSEEICSGSTCSFDWYEPYEDHDTGGDGSTPLPLGPPPPPAEREDLDGLCVSWNITGLSHDLGGGWIRLDICFGEGEQYDIEQCTDYPEWGSSACPFLSP